MEHKILVEIKVDNEIVFGENSKGIDLKIADKVIVLDENNYKIAEVLSEERVVEKVKSKTLQIIRKFTIQDEQRVIANIQKSKEAYKIIREKINFYDLPMKLVNTEYSFDRSKLFVYYTAEKHIDFRKLVSELAQRFKTRIQMVQIGPRDETKIFGGVGICGREICCKSWIKKMSSVSVEMAKVQQLSLNIPKLSGVCNRLKCCLVYEYDFYKECFKKMPKIGAKVYTPDGEGKVVGLDCIKEIITVEIQLDQENKIRKSYPLSAIQIPIIHKIKQGIGIEK